MELTVGANVIELKRVKWCQSAWHILNLLEYIVDNHRSALLSGRVMQCFSEEQIKDIQDKEKLAPNLPKNKSFLALGILPLGPGMSVKVKISFTASRKHQHINKILSYS